MGSLHRVKFTYMTFKFTRKVLFLKATLKSKNKIKIKIKTPIPHHNKDTGGGIAFQN